MDSCDSSDDNSDFNNFVCIYDGVPMLFFYSTGMPFCV